MSKKKKRSKRRSRGLGRVYQPKNDRGQQSPYYSIVYSHHGKRVYEATKSESKTYAESLLTKRLGDRDAGKTIANARRVTLAQLRELVTRQYSLDGNKSVARVKQAFSHLVEFFGEKAKAADITPAQLDTYAEQRLAAGRSRATANYELAQLRRSFCLAIQKQLLAVMPSFDLPKPRNTRTGFFDRGELAALLLNLPRDVGDLVQFLAATGWRRDEGRLLQRANVDRANGTIRLEESRSKSGKPRVFPFGLAPALAELIDQRWEQRDGLYVFHRNGRPLGKDSIRSAWSRGVKRAGLNGRLLHDLRRTFARDYRKKGVSEGEIMKLAGWETRSMFDRYNIIDEADLAAAVAKFSGTTAKPSPTEESPNSVSPSDT